MTRREAVETAVLALAASALGGAAAEAAGGGEPAKGGPARAAVLLKKPLAGVEGKAVTLGTVGHPPGAASGQHRHPAPIFGYAAEGLVGVQIDNGPVVLRRHGARLHEH